MSATIPPHIPFPATASYPVRTGNRVRPLIDGVPAFRRICEAVDQARRSVWVTVTFLWPEFALPDGRGSLFDLLDDATRRGLDVRVIFWRPGPELTAATRANTFSGSAADRELLRARGSRFRIRWDRAAEGFCQHQKSWLIDAGEPGETAFIGGINLNPHSVVAPGHVGTRHNHDLYLELTGPSASDVHHNFAQRWNEASERLAGDGSWGHDGADALDFPRRAGNAAGDAIVQIQRTVHAGCYADGRATPGGAPYPIAAGERSILDQYLSAIAAARRSIYIENQAISVEAILAALAAALDRGVAVTALVPAAPEEQVRADRRKPERQAYFDLLAALGRRENFTLAGIAGPDGKGGRAMVHVHGKIMLIDDAWATIGSCNLHVYSLFGNAEMNASFWDPPTARALRCGLLAEHLGQDVTGLDDRAALALYRGVARDNRRRHEAGDPDWRGLAFSLDPGSYAT